MEDELTQEEYIRGGQILIRKIKKFHPRIVAVLGIGAFRTAFAQPTAKIGLQTEKVNDTKMWLLPNPSGLNANYQIENFVELFSGLREAAQEA